MARPETYRTSANGIVEDEPRNDLFLISEDELSRKVAFRLNHPDSKIYGITKVVTPGEEDISGLPYSTKGYERVGEDMTARISHLQPDTRNFWGTNGFPQRIQVKREALEVDDNGVSVSLERVHYKRAEEKPVEDGQGSSYVWIDESYFVARIGEEAYWINGSVGDDFGGGEKDILGLPKVEKDRVAKLFLPREAPQPSPLDLD